MAGDEYPKNLVILGERGSGKSCIGNLLLKLQHGDGEIFSQHGSSSPQQIQRVVGELVISCVEVPGFFKAKHEIALEDWNNVIISECLLKQGVHVFVLALNAKRPKQSKLLVESFVELYGFEAPVWSLVLFTHADELNQHNALRIIKYQNFGYLTENLGVDFPYVICNHSGEKQTTHADIVKHISNISKAPPYTIDKFRSAQIDFLEKTLKRKKAPKRRLEPEDLNKMTDVPGIFVRKLFAKDLPDFRRLADMLARVHTT